MSLEFALRPSSIEGIKRLADRIQRDEAIQRAEALERASRSAGYSNYAHARRSLADSLVPERPRHDIHITAYWHDLPTGETGRETLVIVVDHRLDERIDRSQFANNRHLLSFRRKESDHVDGKQVFGDQRTARKAVCGAAARCTSSTQPVCNRTRGHWCLRSSVGSRTHFRVPTMRAHGATQPQASW